MAKKLQLGYREIEQRLADSFAGGVNPAEVGYKLLYSFGKSERDIERYKEGKGVLKNFDGLLIKGLFCYQPVSMFGLTEQLEYLKKNQLIIKAAPKIIAVSDGKSILAYDLREKDTYENQLERLPSDFAFFYPLMDVERVHYVEESPADIKAAEKLAKLHDELRSYNEFRSDDDLHDLNLFISRLLFCLFAEDTGIFEDNLFTSSIQRYTKEDGSDISDYLDWSFNIMNVSLRKADTPSIIKQFPYVNGGLFSKKIQIPKMGAKARRLIIECGELNWKDINPDIFGSMIQAVVNPEERANQGMHYTSVPNIMKVINPLFLDELRGEYNKLNEFYEQRKQMLQVGALIQKQFYEDLKPVIRKGNALLKRMSQMKFFDPACGSGNFLIITYKCLRFLEMDILALQRKCTPEGEILFVDNSVISLSQFYGIELLDFPHEVAMLSLWLAEHQMNTKLNEDFGVNTKALPLKNITQIVCGNACRIDWNVVCPHTSDEEVYIFGNPPYLGSRMQSKEHKEDILFVAGEKGRSLDYISCWFIKATDYIANTKSKSAFVSTNSICQGEQVSLLWEPILNKAEIFFAYTSFKWSNNAKYQAAVICVIIGLQSSKNGGIKRIYSENNASEVNNINPYLTSGHSIFIGRRANPLSDDFPVLRYGSMPNDGGNLVLDKYEVDELISNNPQTRTIIKEFIGSFEFINRQKRWCLYIKDKDLPSFEDIPEISKRLLAVTQHRMSSTESSTRALADMPNKFYYSAYEETDAIIIPRVSSERRKYVPIGIVSPDVIISDSALAMYNAKIWILGVVMSYIHMVWMKNIGGKLKTDYRYSPTLVYNNFPFPKISAEKKQEIESAAEEVLITREYYPEKTLAELYDPDKMPQDLREAHAKLDDIVESCYPGYPFASDEARLECLFKLYEKMTSK
jgi:hypothetical protein